MNLDNIISEPKSLLPAFEIAFTNGHEEFANYLYKLHYVWNNYVLKNAVPAYKWSNHYDQHWQQYLDFTYECWSDMDVVIISKKLNSKLLKSMKYAQYEILLILAVSNNQIEYTKKLLNEIPNKSHRINIELILSYSPTKSVLRNLELFALTVGYEVSISGVLNYALKNANYSLAKSLVKNIDDKSFFYTLSSLSPYSLNFAKKYIIPTFVSNNYWPLTIGNKYVVYKILNNVTIKNMSDNNDEDNIAMILHFHEAFSENVFEYIYLLRDYVGCITALEYKVGINEMIKTGNYYMVQIFVEKAIVCQ